jgi:hypothetical protein
MLKHHLSPEPHQGLGSQLLAAKPTLRDESLASWVQRVCGDHQYSMPTLIRSIGYEPVLRDWDLPVPYEVRHRMKRMLELGPEHQHQSLSLLGALCLHMPPSQLLWHERRQPKYRWCPKCLKKDPVPYLRWYWRLSALLWCPRHQVLLSELCPACDAPLLLHASRLVAVGKHGHASTLADCDRCGASLCGSVRRGSVGKDAQKAALELLITAFGQVHLFADEAVAERARAYLTARLPSITSEGKRQAPYRLSLRDFAPARPHSDAEALTEREFSMRQRHEKAWLRSLQCQHRLWSVQQHNAALAGNYTAFRKGALKVQWSWSLDAHARLAMAAVLYITRVEKGRARRLVEIT